MQAVNRDGDVAGASCHLSDHRMERELIQVNLTARHQKIMLKQPDTTSTPIRKMIPTIHKRIFSM
jgi:hypothetical protein